jgi:hypothetical protein
MQRATATTNAIVALGAVNDPLLCVTFLGKGGEWVIRGIDNLDTTSVLLTAARSLAYTLAAHRPHPTRGGRGCVRWTRHRRIRSRTLSIEATQKIVIIMAFGGAHDF